MGFRFFGSRPRAVLPALMLGIGLCAVAPACGVSEVPDRRRELMRSWGEDFLLVEYQRAIDRGEQLGERVAELCSEPSELRLEAARDAWWAMREPWKRTELFAFGPYQALPDKLGAFIDFWPARPDSVVEVLESDDELDADALGAPTRGFTTAEYLLYEAESDDFSEEAGARRCQYLAVVVADLVELVQQLRNAWDPDQGNYLDELLQAGRGSAVYDTLPMALSEVVNRMAFTIENTRADKLGAPAGLTSEGGAQPDKMESPFSGRAIQDIHDTLHGIQTLYFGETAPRGGGGEILGLTSYLRHRGYNYDAGIRAGLDSAHAALDDIEPLNEAIDGATEDVELAIDRLTALQRLIQVDLINALSLSVRFNDNDGD